MVEKICFDKKDLTISFPLSSPASYYDVKIKGKLGNLAYEKIFSGTGVPISPVKILDLGIVNDQNTNSEKTIKIKANNPVNFIDHATIKVYGSPMKKVLKDE